jgi:two-component system chemotaxis sensor kinase CheA
MTKDVPNRDHESSLKEFLAEAEEIIESLNDDLAHFFEGGSNDPDLLNSIFRSAHSLKGLSRMFGFEPVERLSHNLEDLLDGMRMGKVDLTGEVMDLLLEAVTVIRSLLAVKSRGEEVDVGIEEIIDRLNGAIAKHGPGVEGGASSALVDKSILNVLTEYEEHRLNTCIKRGLNILKVQASFPIMSFDDGLEELTTVLKECGEVITTLPSPGSSPGETINFDIVVAVNSTQGEVEKAIDNDAIKVVGTLSSTEVVPVGGVMAPKASAEEGLKSLTRTVRVDISKLDSLMNTIGDLIHLKSSISGVAESLKNLRGVKGLAKELAGASKGLDKKLSELQQGLLDTRMVPLGNVFNKVSRAAKKLGKELGKDVLFEIGGSYTELDKLIVEELANPLMHILRNSVDHGIEGPEERKSAGKSEKGTIRLNARQGGNYVIVEIEDDGRGIDHEVILEKATAKGLVREGHTMRKEEILDFMFLPGFSTKDEVSEVSGRGVGMDVVKENIAALSGMVEIETEKALGTKVLLVLPMTLAIVQALIVRVAGNLYAIPLNSVLENFFLSPSDIETIETKEFVHLRDSTLPIIRLKEFFGLDGETDKGKYVVVVGLAERRIGVVVDRLIGEQDIVMRSVGKRLRQVNVIAGATDYRNETILVIDVGGIIEECIGVHGSYRMERT